MKKQFNESLNTAVFTTNYILNGSPILHVYHYEEDGAWQFSGIEQENEEDIKVISLEEIINLDNSILELTDLELGGEAYRKDKNSDWIIKN
ncbi:MAG: hypothetical protein ABI315_15965 [Bacteroidia bacterium]